MTEETAKNTLDNLTADQKVQLRGYLQEAEKSVLIRQGANDSIKGARKLAKKELGVSAKNFNNLLNNRLNANLEKKIQELEEAEELYEKLYGKPSADQGVTDA